MRRIHHLVLPGVVVAGAVFAVAAPLMRPAVDSCPRTASCRARTRA
jgi:hypothetical protein